MMLFKSLFTIAISGLIGLLAAAEEGVPGMLVPTPNFRTPKNIAFSTLGGGSSHHTWVLEILKEMHQRGHNVSMYSRGDQLRFAKAYPMVKTQQVGGPDDFVRNPIVTSILSNHLPQEKLCMRSLEACMLNYPTEYQEFKALFESEKIDLVVCDSFAINCMDAAILSKIPLVITTTFGVFSDSGAPYINSRLFTQSSTTTQNQSLWTRIYRDFVTTPLNNWRLSKKMKVAHAYQKKLGLKPTIEVVDSRFNGVMKLMNNVYGIEVPRKLSPLVNMVGPILCSHYLPLDPATKAFLDGHRKVVFVAFGQHAIATEQDIQIIMQTLLRLMEQGHIDGVIWARLSQDKLPTRLQTPNHTYSHQDIATHRDIFLTAWARQFAILQHPSTSWFLGHGGTASMHEAIHSGVRLFVYPFFGDQPGNAMAIERIGIGKFIDTTNPKYDAAYYDLLYKKMYEVAADPENKIQDTVNRYRAYIQIMSVNAVSRGADLIEETLFASDEEGKLYHRYDIGYEMSWIKRNNVDEYATVGVIALGIVQLGIFVWRNALQSKVKVVAHKSKRE